MRERLTSDMMRRTDKRRALGGGATVNPLRLPLGVPVAVSVIGRVAKKRGGRKRNGTK